eukprot:PhF_6_TR35999/c1_g1_i2/m.52154
MRSQRVVAIGGEWNGSTNFYRTTVQASLSNAVEYDHVCTGIYSNDRSVTVTTPTSRHTPSHLLHLYLHSDVGVFIIDRRSREKCPTEAVDVVEGNETNRKLHRRDKVTAGLYTGWGRNSGRAGMRILQERNVT